jgi:protein SCO1/2
VTAVVTGPRRRWWLAGAILWIGVAVMVGTWVVVVQRGGGPALRLVAAENEPLPALGTLPRFELTERSGRAVGLADLHGRVWVATFFFTRCRDTCALQNARLARLQTEFSAAPDVRLVSISVDSQHDTPAVLERYAGGFRADPARWLFLTGDPTSIAVLAQESFRVSVILAARAAPNGATPVLGHSPGLILVDRAARIRGYYRSEDGPEVDRLRRDVARLLEDRS